MRRGTELSVGNRYERFSRESFDDGWNIPDEERPRLTEWYADRSKSILSKNDSPDVPHTWSLNPYRGCEHGCVYCYARPSHEYLGFDSGVDFESKILVKREAPALLHKELSKPSWNGDSISLSGNTDCYQPLEAELRITRGCLEVFVNHGNPVAIVTKNHLVTRDIDLLSALAKEGLVTVTLSIPTLNSEVTRTMEPRASVPERRLKAIEELAAAGIPVGVLVAPVIPGLTDRDIPAVLAQAAVRGALFASMQMVRLPMTVEPIFVDWLRRERPLEADRVIAHVRDVRGGALNSSNFGERMTGTGPQADGIRRLFRLSVERNGLNREPRLLATKKFRRPAQLDLIGGG
jgi:DNA repair photolyase